jgi:hypothetical protein
MCSPHSSDELSHRFEELFVIAIEMFSFPSNLTAKVKTKKYHYHHRRDLRVIIDSHWNGMKSRRKRMPAIADIPISKYIKTPIMIVSSGPTHK